MQTQTKAVIKAVGHFVPERIVKNSDLVALMETSNEWIVERTGICERRYAEKGTKTSDLACRAAEAALAKGGYSPKDIDYLIAATLSPDYYFPGIAPIIQQKIGLNHIPALDIRTQCSGFVYGVSLADAIIRSGQAKRVLLVCAETQSICLDFTTKGRDMAVLFGDGAAAVILEAETCTNIVNTNKIPLSERGIIDSLMGSDGSGAEILCIKSPGSATPNFISHADIDAGATFPKMEGKVVFKNAVQRMSEALTTITSRNNIKIEELDLLVFHQANLRINEYLREKLGLPKEKVFNNIQKYGNTTAATIPLCLSEAEEAGVLKKGHLVATVAFGAGFTWGANLIRW